MTISFRKAEPDDVPAIARTHIAAWRETYPGILPASYLDGLSVKEFERLWEEKMSRPGAVCLVAVEGGEVVGIASGGVSGGWISTARPGYDCQLYSLYVLQEFQGCGIGGGLFRGISDGLFSGGGRAMVCSVISANAKAVAFYGAKGGKNLGSGVFDVCCTQVEETFFGWSFSGGNDRD